MTNLEHHHEEDHTVCYRVGLFLLAVLAGIFLIGLFN
jgi:hypothetical protein